SDRHGPCNACCAWRARLPTWPVARPSGPRMSARRSATACRGRRQPDASGSAAGAARRAAEAVHRALQVAFGFHALAAAIGHRLADLRLAVAADPAGVLADHPVAFGVVDLGVALLQQVEDHDLVLVLEFADVLLALDHRAQA